MPSVKEIPVRFVVERAKAQNCADAALPYRTLIADWYEENHYTLEGYETLHEIDEHFPELREKPKTDSQTEPIIIPGCVLGRFRTDPESAKLLVQIIHEIHRRMTIPQKVYDVALDEGTPVSVNFNSNLNEKPENIYSIYYPTVASRVVEKVVELPISGDGDIHTLTIHPQDPGIVFEKIVIDLGGYQRQFLFGKESPKTYK